MPADAKIRRAMEGQPEAHSRGSNQGRDGPRSQDRGFLPEDHPPDGLFI